MSPLRIESEYQEASGIKVTEIRESAYSFIVGPAYAIRILNVSRTTLFRYDSDDVQRVDTGGGPRTIQRVYNDSALLRIAQETKRVKILEQDGKTLLIAPKCRTVLDIPFAQQIV